MTAAPATINSTPRPERVEAPLALPAAEAELEVPAADPELLLVPELEGAWNTRY